MTRRWSSGGAPRKTSGRSTWGRFKRHYWGVLLRYRQGAPRWDGCMTDKARCKVGKGIHVAFIADTREQVQSLYEQTTGTARNGEGRSGLARRVGR